jgi:hypothetical protein
MRLYDAMVDPVMSYGCQVWGPWLFYHEDGLAGRNVEHTAAEKVHLDFLRIMAGVGKTTKQVLLLHDFQRLPVLWRWVALSVRMWCRLTS